jgi:hypothetical protein
VKNRQGDRRDQIIGGGAQTQAESEHS